MALMPKRVKHRKSQRGRIKGNATRGNTVVFGDFGLQSLQAGWIKAQTIEAGRIAAQQYVRGEGRLYVRIFPHKLDHVDARWKHVWARGKGNPSTGSRLGQAGHRALRTGRGDRGAGQGVLRAAGPQDAHAECGLSDRRTA